MRTYRKKLSGVLLGTILILAACGGEDEVKENEMVQSERIQEVEESKSDKFFAEFPDAKEKVIPKGETASVQFEDFYLDGNGAGVTVTAEQKFKVLESLRGDEAIELYKKYEHDAELLKSILENNPSYEMALVKIETTISDILDDKGTVLNEYPLQENKLLKFRSVESGENDIEAFLEVAPEMRINPSRQYFQEGETYTVQLPFQEGETYTGYLIGMVKKDEEFFVYHQNHAFKELVDGGNVNADITIFEVK